MFEYFFNFKTSVGKLASVALLILMSISTPLSYAQTQMKQQIGGPFKPVENKSVKNGLAVMLLSVDDMPELVRQWYQTAHTPRLKAASTARTGQQITSMVFFTGCQANKEKKCDVSVQYAVKMGEQKINKIPPQTLYRSVPPVSGNMIMGSAMLNTVIEKTDPRGVWVVEASITDNVAKTTVNVKTRFQVLP